MRSSYSVFTDVMNEDVDFPLMNNTNYTVKVRVPCI